MQRSISFFLNTKQNAAVFLIVSLLAFSSVLALLTYDNFSGDDMALMTLVGIERTDIEVAVNGKSETEIEELLAQFEQKEEIDRGILTGTVSVTICDDTKELAVNADIYSDFSGLVIDTIYQGSSLPHDSRRNPSDQSGLFL